MAAASNPYLILDDFLPVAEATRLLAAMLAAEPNFTPSLVGEGKAATQDLAYRSSLRLPGRMGVDLDPFKAAVVGRFDALCAATGIAPFTIHHVECSIVAHGDGDHYRTHVDTRTGDPESEARHVRLLSCVYYLHGSPRRFAGGALAIHGLGPLGGAVIEPQHNRLVAFPAFVPHEVLPVSCPGDAFADRRFSINCWLHRAR
jgi:SM-20-related protein